MILLDLHSQLSQLATLVHNDRFTTMFVVDYFPYTLRTPFVCRRREGVAGDIIITESFLSFLWAFLWATTVIVEEGVIFPAKQNDSNIFQGPINFQSTQNLQSANNLFNYIHSLCMSYTQIRNFQNSLPNPYLLDNYTKGINTLFIYSIASLIYHEIGHIVKTQTNDNKLNELNADEFAIDSLRNCIDNNLLRFTMNFNEDQRNTLLNRATIMPLIAQFVLLKNLEGITHPNIVERINHSYKQLNLIKYDSINDEFLGLSLGVGLNIFLHNKNLMQDFTRLFPENTVTTVPDLVRIIFQEWNKS